MFLDRHTTGDGILTALRLLDVIVRSGRGLHDLAKAVPRFPQVLLNVRVKDRDGLPEAQPIWDEVRLVAGELDEDGRVLVRASGTEPVVRVMVEATSADLARAAAERVAGVIERTLA
jgi:phosphoglucosamine mutase